MSELCVISKSLEPTKSRPKVEDFVVIKVFSSDGKIAHTNFIEKISDGPDDNNDFEVSFTKQSEKIKDGFQLPEDEAAGSVALNDIVKILPKPVSVATMKRLSRIFKLKAGTTIVNFCVQFILP